MKQQTVHPLRFGLWFKLKNHIWQEASLAQWLSRQLHTTRSNKIVQLWFWSETLCGMLSMLSCLLFTKSYPFKLRKILLKIQTNKNTVICQFLGGLFCCFHENIVSRLSSNDCILLFLYFTPSWLFLENSCFTIMYKYTCRHNKTSIHSTIRHG